MAQVVECLPSKLKALSSTLVPPKVGGCQRDTHYQCSTKYQPWKEDRTLDQEIHEMFWSWQ
jgi:hypothetical protein